VDRPDDGPAQGAREALAVGVSTAALPPGADFDHLLQYAPDVIEIYNHPAERAEALCAWARERGIGLALHTPTPYDEPQPLRRYCPTGPDTDEASTARRLVAATAAFGAAIGARHVIVHYPTPYPPFDQKSLDDFGRVFLEHLEDLVDRHGVPILIENLSTNPLLSTPEDYAQALAEYPGIGFCLDLGHAHLMRGSIGPLDYVRALGRRIRSLHIYNTTPDRYRSFGHERAGPGQAVGDGFMDLATIVSHAVATCRPRTLVLEHQGPLPAGEAQSCAEWLRTIVQATEERRPGRRSPRYPKASR
jgi:sugar phosphate isomerase/epimerase